MANLNHLLCNLGYSSDYLEKISKSTTYPKNIASHFYTLGNPEVTNKNCSGRHCSLRFFYEIYMTV